MRVRSALLSITACVAAVLLPSLTAAPAYAVDSIAQCNAPISGTMLVDIYSTYQDITISNVNGSVTVQTVIGSVTCATPTSNVGAVFFQPATQHAHHWLIDLTAPFASTEDGPLARLVLSSNPGDAVMVATTSSDDQRWRYLSGDDNRNEFTLDNDGTSDLSLAATMGELTMLTGTGNDTVELWNGGATPYPGNLGTNIQTGDGNDIVHGGQGHDAIMTGGGDDVAWGGPGNDGLYDAQGVDVYYGDLPDSPSDNSDSFAMANDFEPDQVNPGTAQGIDSLAYESFGMPVSISLDGIANDGYNDGFIFEGDNFNGLQRVVTGGGDDVIDAAGLMFIESGAGDDTLRVHEHPLTQAQWLAAAGNDTVDLSVAPLDTGYGQLDGSGQGFFALESGGVGWAIYVSDIERAVGTPHADTMLIGCACVARPGAGNDTVTLGDGATFLAESTPDGADAVAILDGASATINYGLRASAVALTSDDEANDGATGEGDNIAAFATTLVGGAGNDTIVGSATDNVILGGGGANSLNGRGGNDRLWGGPVADSISGGAGNDVLRGDGGSDKLNGGDGDDVLLGDAASDTASFGNDTLDGGNGDDDVFGYAGSDTFLGGAAANGSDLVSGGSGIDTASYSLRATALKLTLNGLYDDGAAGEGDRLGSDVENLVGGKGADLITGSNAANALTGGPGKDTLSGLGGNDVFQTLDGLVDILNGGTGTDKAHRDTTDKVTSVELRF